MGYSEQGSSGRVRVFKGAAIWMRKAAAPEPGGCHDRKDQNRRPTVTKYSRGI